jgi:hypothetical protein
MFKNLQKGCSQSILYNNLHYYYFAYFVPCIIPQFKSSTITKTDKFKFSFYSIKFHPGIGNQLYYPLPFLVIKTVAG